MLADRPPDTPAATGTETLVDVLVGRACAAIGLFGITALARSAPHGVARVARVAVRACVMMAIVAALATSVGAALAVSTGAARSPYTADAKQSRKPH